MQPLGSRTTRGVNDPRVEFVGRGRRPHPATVAYAREKVLAAARAAPRNVTFARVTLTFEKHPSNERPAKAEAMLDVDGRVVHAEAVARSSTEAIDLVQQRLRRRLDGLRRRRPRQRKGVEGRGGQG
ncbi:MAG TPA: HPF/RaiA family ribosome-associated protein [Actinomycetota bacterium]